MIESDDRQDYISDSRHASFCIAKAEACQTTCLSFSPILVCSLFQSIADSPSTTNFSNCPPRNSELVYADCLGSRFSIFQSKALRSRARGCLFKFRRARSYLSELRRATCPDESRSSFCSPSTYAKVLAAGTNLSCFTATVPEKVAYSMLKHLPRSGMDYLLHIFNLSWSLHSFPSIWKTPHNPLHKIRKPLNSPAFFGLSSASYVSKLFKRFIPPRLLFFLESQLFLSPRLAGFRSGLSTLYQIFFIFLSPFRIGLTNPGWVLGRFLLRSTFPKLSILAFRSFS